MLEERENFKWHIIEKIKEGSILATFLAKEWKKTFLKLSFQGPHINLKE